MIARLPHDWQPFLGFITSGKTVLTDDGPVDIDVPRDREGSYEQLIVACQSWGDLPLESGLCNVETH